MDLRLIASSWLYALKLIPATWGWSRTLSVSVILVPGSTVIALDWACRAFSIPISESNPEADLASVVVSLLAFTLIVLGWLVAPEIEGSTSGIFLRHLPIHQGIAVLTNCLKTCSFTFAVTLSAAFGLVCIGAPGNLYGFLLLAYLLHLVVAGVSATLTLSIAPYMRAWQEDHRQCVYSFIGMIWMCTGGTAAWMIASYHLKNKSDFTDLNWVHDWLGPSAALAVASWMIAWFSVSVPVVRQRFRARKSIRQPRHDTFEASMLSRKQPGRADFLFILRGWGWGFLPALCFIIASIHLQDMDLSVFVAIEESAKGLARIVLLVGTILALVPITVLLTGWGSRLPHLICLWQTLPVPSRWGVNFFAVGILAVTIGLEVDWLLSGRTGNMLLGVGVAPCVLQIILFSALCSLNPTTLPRSRELEPGVKEGLVILIPTGVIVVSVLSMENAAPIVAVPLLLTGIGYGYWAMHWMWKRY